MRSITTLLLASLFVLTSSQSFATRTGSFDTTISFHDTTRVFSCYAPTAYSDTNRYRLMVCLHGLGDNSVNYRNAIVSSLQWSKYFPKTIFVCPEAASTTTDFDQSDSDGMVVDSCIRFAMARYHIDTANIILQGFSLGGRAALRYGLEHYQIFRGLLLNTPAIQGVKDALNMHPSYLFAYPNAAHIPIYITHGDQDILYEPPIDTALKAMIAANGKVRYNDIAGLAHSIPAFSKMSDVIRFFDTSASLPGTVLQATELDVPARTCLDSIAPRFVVRNVGSDTVSLLSYSITLNGQATPGMSLNSLVPFQSVLIQGSNLVPQSGTNVLSVSLGNGNTLSDTFYAASSGVSLPMSEDFEDTLFPPLGWAVEPSGDVYSEWSPDNTAAKTGSISLEGFNTILIFDNEGRADGLLTPVVNLTTVAHPQLSFDLAFDFDRYTPPYFTDTVDFTDTLDILISTDCGATWTSLYRKAGAALQTYASPIINPLSIQDDLVNPADSEWRTESVDLSSYASATEATVKFNYISGLGGIIHIDNVRIAGPLAVEAHQPPLALSIYPNPATNMVTVEADGKADGQITLYDMVGREVLTQDLRAGQSTIDCHSISAGNYVVRLTEGSTVESRMLTIAR